MLLLYTELLEHIKGICTAVANYVHVDTTILVPALAPVTDVPVSTYKQVL